jgi:hypothetical protein
MVIKKFKKKNFFKLFENKFQCNLFIFSPQTSQNKFKFLNMLRNLLLLLQVEFWSLFRGVSLPRCWLDNVSARIMQMSNIGRGKQLLRAMRRAAQTKEPSLCVCTHRARSD